MQVICSIVAVQPNGERLPVEYWVYREWLYGRLNSRTVADLESAEQIIVCGCVSSVRPGRPISI
jgi:hypothetical protein